MLVETDLGAGTMLLERLDPTRSLATLPLTPRCTTSRCSGGSANLGSPSIPACCAATSGSTSPAACGTGSTRCPTPRRSTSSWTSSPTLRARPGTRSPLSDLPHHRLLAVGSPAWIHRGSSPLPASRHRAASVTRPSLPRGITRSNDGSLSWPSTSATRLRVYATCSLLARSSARRS